MVKYNIKEIGQCSLLVILLLVPLIHSQDQFSEELPFEKLLHEVNGHGDFCNATVKCDATIWLRCNETTTECICEEGMAYYNATIPCVSKIGDACQTDSTDKPKRCIEKALCINRTCGCEQGYFPDPLNETCLSGVNKTCEASEDCNYYALLGCRDRTCLCDDSAGHIWDTITSKCRSTAGSSCTNTSTIPITCVDNADCDSSMNICRCQDKFQETPSKECKLRYNETCTTSDQCHPQFKCNTVTGTALKTCSCDAANQEYDAKNGVCNNLAGKGCNTVTNPYCVSNALCSSLTNKCTCKADYEQSANGKCVTGYASDCSLDSEICNAESKLECNSVEKRCQCTKGYSYSTTRKCLGMSGANCTATADCYDRASCSTTSKQCECNGGFSETPEGNCLLAYNAPCTGMAPGSCNPYDFLLCSVANQICDCESTNMTFSSEKQACVSLVDAVCFTRMIEGRQLDCVTNATCSTDSGSGSTGLGKCQCIDGFNADSGSRLCAKTNGVERLWPYCGLSFLVGIIVFVMI